jgi:hypothetical protein
MATIRATAGALLSTVSTTATVITSTVSMVGDSVAYADNYMKSILHDQRITLAHEEETSYARAEEKAAQAQAERDLETARFMAQSPDHAKFYISALTRHQAITERLKAAAATAS